MRYALACLTLFVVGSVVVVFAFSGDTPKAETIAPRTDETSLPQISEIHGYQNWTKVNPQPVLIGSPQVSILCGRPITFDRKRELISPHEDKLITVYVNEIGRQAMMTELKPQFPVGSVIVKEKLSPEKRSGEPELLTVMIKREHGFNPGVGDWEFMAANGAGTTVDARGKLESCQACHVMMKKRDFISPRSYLPEELRSKLR